MPKQIANLPLLNNLIAADRTSITRYEAVEYLMVLSNLNPPRLQLLSEDAGDEEIEVHESITVLDLLRDSRNAAEADLCNAVDDVLPKETIAEMSAKLDKCEELLVTAHNFLCTIDHELEDGGALKKDSRATKHKEFPYITLRSFVDWIDDNHLFNQEINTGQVMDAQEDAIIAEITRLGLNPKSLPKNAQGKPGVKAKVKIALQNNPLFKGATNFKHAWERLREDLRIVDEK